MYKPFSSFTGSMLYAFRESWFNHTVLLRDTKETYGKMFYPGFLHTRVVAEMSDGSWSFKRAGFFDRTILVSGSTGITGQLKRYWFGRGGELTLADGRQLTFLRPHFWSRIHTWHDPQRGEVMKIRAVFFSKMRAEITVQDTIISNPLLPLLAFVGIHLIESARRRHAAAGGGAH